MGQPIETILEQKCRMMLAPPEDRKFWKKEIKLQVQNHGYDEVVSAFDVWIETQQGYTGRRPITEFLWQLPNLVGNVSAAKPSSANLRKVEEAIALISDNQVVFNNHTRPALAAIIMLYSPEDVIAAFRDFYEKHVTDDYQRKFAAKTFVETGAVLVNTLVTRRKKQQELETQAQLAVDRARKQMEDERLSRLQEETEEQDILADGL